MGESKSRKASDPYYGKVPKDQRKRGIVVSPPVEIQAEGLYAKDSNIDAQELRFALLFWDELVWPSSKAIHFESNEDERFLECAGVLRRPIYTYSGAVWHGYALGQIQAFRDLESKEPGCWALAQGENSLLLRNGLVEEGGGLSITLHRSIPVPKGDVPLAEILEFRTRRRDQIYNLRYCLDSLVKEIEKEGAGAISAETAAASVEVACAELLNVSREWQFPVYLSDLKTSFSFNPVKAGGYGVAAWSFAKDFGIVAGASAASIASLASTIEVKADCGLRSIKRPSSPYRYVYSIHSELA